VVVDEASDSVLDRISSPADLKALSLADCERLAAEIRAFIVETVRRQGGHLGSNLGVVELTIALHRVFDSPRDRIVFDTGHQAYVHKLLTGRQAGFARLREEGGLSGYPNRAESPHDLVENSHASTACSYAYGLAKALELAGETGPGAPRVVAVVGDGALTGGMAYEALNNLGHAGLRVLVVWNDNGRSYAPTVSRLSESLTQLRLSPAYLQIRERLRNVVRDLPSPLGPIAYSSLHGLAVALREAVEPRAFFEALGVRYTGPIDGHDLAGLEAALAKAASWPGPMVLHVLTVKGKGYGPAEADELHRLHDLKAPRPSPPATSRWRSFTEAFSEALLAEAERRPELVALTAAMPEPTGLLPFARAHPTRVLDVGIAEQHALGAAAGLALGGRRPVVAIYSTFLSRAFDQWNLDVGLHRLPVVVAADRAGITGDDGPSHHGLYDLCQALMIPGCAIFCPSEAAEVAPMLAAALDWGGPALLRYPKTPPPPPLGPPGEGLSCRVLREAGGEVLLVGIGKLAAACLEAARLLEAAGVEASVVDARVVRPAPPELVERMAQAGLVVTAEDGLVHGGAGAFLVSLARQAAEAAGRRPPEAVVLGVPTAYIPQARPDAILARLGLDGPGIAATALAALERQGVGAGIEECLGQDRP
jgi:1-deoxy-D-xylulose-5-phosphate synthase